MGLCSCCMTPVGARSCATGALHGLRGSAPLVCSRIAQRRVHVSAPVGEASRFALFRTEQTETVRLRQRIS